MVVLIAVVGDAIWPLATVAAAAGVCVSPVRYKVLSSSVTYSCRGKDSAQRGSCWRDLRLQDHDEEKEKKREHRSAGKVAMDA